MSHDMLSHVDMHTNEAFGFSCERLPWLCKCISAIGSGKVGDQVFFANDLELTVYRNDDGYAAYEIKEGDDYIGYGDVNEGRVDTGKYLMYRHGRRHLLQGGHNGGS